MHEITLLINIAVALGVAFCGGLLARRIGLPTIVGYLIAGIAISPFTPGFVGDTHTIGQLADLGVIFLLFGVGLHFSLRDLWAVRDIALPGALAQIALLAALGFALTRGWGWSASAGLVLGFAIAIASTVVMVRALTDHGLLQTISGRVAVGWLVVEDLAAVLLLVLLPALAVGAGQHPVWQTVGLALLKGSVFAVLMLFVGARVIPWLLMRVAHTRSRELFILAVVVITVGTAVVAAQFFGVSLALGAFLAGVVISESSLSHQVGAEVLPFRETFAVLFFVSVGMLVDPRTLVASAGQLLALTALIVVGKPLLTLPFGLLFPYPARTTFVLAVGRAQIGEFSFILGQAGVMLGLLTQQQYSLLLEAAVLSILLNPFLWRAEPLLERLLRRAPFALWRRLDRHGPALEPVGAGLSGHVVVVGCGRVGAHIVTVLGLLGIPRLVIEVDVERVSDLARRRIPALFGDAANSEVLTYAALERARALVVTVPDEAAAQVIVAAAHDQAPTLPIVVRAATRPGIARLAQLGAREVVLPELEGGIEIVRSALLLLGLPTSDVQHYADSVRDGRYCPADAASATPGERVALDQLRLDQLMHASTAMDMSWLCLGPESPLVGQPLSAARPRTPRRARIIVIVRAGRVMPHPEPTLRLKVNDIIGVIGERADPSEDALAERREGELGGEQRGPIVRVEDRVDLDEIQT